LIINTTLLIDILDKFDTSDESFGIINQDILNELIFFLDKHGVRIRKNKIENSAYNKLSIALIAINKGINVVDISSKLNWHDFELFSSELLKYHGYTVYTNFRLKNPKREIDIIGIKSQKALLIDCKHWKKKSITGLKQIVENQKNRSKLFIQKSNIKVQNVFPIVLTFLPNGNSFINGVPIISINKLNSFLLDFDNIHQYFYKL
jgi:Holliday junction resolvase-like predicted endonuclease